MAHGVQDVIRDHARHQAKRRRAAAVVDLNSAALRFIPVERLRAEGYERYLRLFETAQR